MESTDHNIPNIPNILSKTDGYRISRNVTADIIKAVAIFGVVYIHVGGGGGTSQFLTDFFRFGVPAFLILFAYFAELSILRGRKAYPYLRARATGLIIPTIAWSTLYWFVFPDFHQLSDFGFFGFLTSLGYAWAGQYFLVVLFFG